MSSLVRLSVVVLSLWLCLGAPPAWGQDSLHWIKQAQAAEDSGKFAQAGRDWEKAAAALGSEGKASHRALSLFQAGLAHYKGGALETAIAQLTLGIEAYLSLGDVEGKSLCLLQRGVVELELGRWPDAERSFRSASEVSRKAGNESRLLEATELLGKTLEAARRWPEATELTEKLLSTYRQSAPERVPETLTTLGALYQLQSQPSKAEQAYQEAATLYQDSGDIESSRKSRRDLARFYLKSQQLDKAETLMSELIKEGSNDLALSVDHAYVLSSLKRHQEALNRLDTLLAATQDPSLLPLLKARRFEQLIALNKEKEALAYLRSPSFGDDQARVQAAEGAGKQELVEEFLRKLLAGSHAADKPNHANSLAIRLIRWDRAAEAAQLLQQTLATLSPQDPRRAVLLSNLAETFLSQGEPSQALPLYLEVLSLTRSGVGNADLSVVLTNIGATYEYLGDYHQALWHLEEAIEVGERYQMPRASQATVYNSLGVVYAKLGRHREAILFYRRALEYHRLHGNSYGETVSLINLGTAFEALQDKEQAKNHYTRALAMAVKEGRRSQQMTVLNNLGQLTGDEEYFRQALEIEASVPQKLTKNILLSNVASLWYGSGKFAEAEALSLQTADTLRELGARENELKARQILVLTALKKKESTAAYHHLDRSLELGQEIVTGLSSVAARHFVAQHEDVWRQALAHMLEGAELEKAFALDELLRSLGLTALVNGLPLQSSHLPAELVEREKSLLGQMREASLRSGNLAALRVEYRQLQEQMERHHLASGSLRNQQPVELAEIRRQLRDDEVMLSYLLGDSDLFLMAISKEEVSACRIASLKELQPLITNVLRLVSNPSREPQTQAALQKLSEALWQPGQRLVAGKSRLILLPAGPVYSVPFAALLQDGAPLAERYHITQASSATAWQLSRRQAVSGRGTLLAALGNYSPEWSQDGFGEVGIEAKSLTPLPGTLKELSAVSSALSNPASLKEQSMTGEQLKKASAGRRGLHFATHGLLNGDEPMLSGLVASDRFVTVAEIFNWKLDADLAVLSACHTASVSQGWEFVSLTRAFQFAGARTLLATNWAISDDATADWMKQFYTRLGQGEAADEAARYATLELRKTYPHPYYWAPFTLWGDGTVNSKSF